MMPKAGLCMTDQVLYMAPVHPLGGDDVAPHRVMSRSAPAWVFMRRLAAVLLPQRPPGPGHLSW